jgi:hypothetical protein
MWTKSPGAVRRILVVVLSLLAVVCEAATEPNILVILASDQGRGDHRAFRITSIRAPQMQLCCEGMTFQKGFANRL